MAKRTLAMASPLGSGGQRNRSVPLTFLRRVARGVRDELRYESGSVQGGATNFIAQFASDDDDDNDNANSNNIGAAANGGGSISANANNNGDQAQLLSDINLLDACYSMYERKYSRNVLQLIVFFILFFATKKRR